MLVYPGFQVLDAAGAFLDQAVALVGFAVGIAGSGGCRAGIAGDFVDGGRHLVDGRNFRMIQVFSQLLSAALGSVGFGLIFNLNRRYLPAAGVGGLLAWLAYLLAANTLHSVFLANLLAGFCAALYAEILARCCNAPSTPFFITAAIPLIPGSTLYYCMNAVVSNDLSAAEHFGEQTFLAALGIAGGMAIAWCLADLSRKLHALAIRSSGK